MTNTERENQLFATMLARVEIEGIKLHKQFEIEHQRLMDQQRIVNDILVKIKENTKLSKRYTQCIAESQKTIDSQTGK